MSDFLKNVSPPKLPFKISLKLIVVVLIVIVIIVAAFMSFFVVDQSEEAVITTFGKYNRIVGPGLQMKLPFGIEQSFIVPTQIVKTRGFGNAEALMDGTTSSSSAIMLTGDLNIVEVEWTILYRISDIKRWLFGNENPDQTLADVSNTIISQLIGDASADSVINGKGRDALGIAAVSLMNQLLDKYNVGATVTEVKMGNINPPAGEVKQAFDDVNTAKQDLNRLINEGDQEYYSKIPEARGNAEQLIQQAQGYATERVNNAQGDAARFLAVLRQYRNDPQNTRVRLYNETMEEVFGGADSAKTNLIDKSLKNAVPLLGLTGGKSVLPQGANQ